MRATRLPPSLIAALALLLLALIGCRAHPTPLVATTSTLPALTVDLDGDGRDDTLQPVLHEGYFVLEVAWDDGTTAFIREVPIHEEGEYHETTTDFSWLVGWSALPNTGDGYDVPVLGQPVHFSIPAALGDGVMCSSMDVAVLLYYTPVGWKMEHLGF